MNPNDSLYSGEVYKLPEYKALCERLGIPWELATTGITIKLGAHDELVEVTQTFRVIDTKKKTETTNLHNKEWVTHKPCPHQS